MGKFRFAKSFLLLVTPLVTGSALAEIAVCIAASPSQAASLALSQTSLEFNNFSLSPVAVQTSTNTDTLAIAGTGSSTTADAQAEATFVVAPPSAFNSSLSKAVGQGSSYLGLAQSGAQVVGNFFIEAGQTFSFDFAAALNITTSIDNPSSEGASATGILLFFLTNSTPTTIYDFLVLSGNLISPGENDVPDLRKSNNITLNESSFATTLSGTQAVALASIKGSLLRRFESSTSLKLIEVKANQVRVQTPEPDNKLALLFFLGFISVSYKVRTKYCSAANFNSINF